MMVGPQVDENEGKARFVVEAVPGGPPGTFQWRLVAENNRTVGTSEPYVSKADALTGAADCAHVAARAFHHPLLLHEELRQGPEHTQVVTSDLSMPPAQ